MKACPFLLICTDKITFEGSISYSCKTCIKIDLGELMKKLTCFVMISCLVVIILAGCAAKADPADAVMGYLTALVGQDADGAVALSCADWEEQAKLETDSFLSVQATLNNVQCKTVVSNDASAEVSCSGMIDMTYNDEVRSIDLSLRTYALQKQAGEWLVCGYK
jgi:hypothetical protein